MSFVVMAGQFADEAISKRRSGYAESDRFEGVRMTSCAWRATPSRLILLAAGLLAAMALMTGQACGQISGRPVAQPYFDYDWHARFDACRWRPVYWGFDPYAAWGENCEEEETGTCRYGFVAHRPNAWYVAADFVPMTF